MRKIKLVLVVLAAVFVVKTVHSSDFGEQPKTEYNVSETYENVSSNIDVGIDNMDANTVKTKYFQLGDTVMYVLDDIGNKFARVLLKLIQA